MTTFEVVAVITIITIVMLHDKKMYENSIGKEA